MTARLTALLAFVILIPNLTFAHSKVNSSDPDSGSQVVEGLAKFELGFTQPVRVTRFGLIRIDASVAAEDLMERDPDDAAALLNSVGASGLITTSKIPKGFSAELTLTFDPLEPGIYQYVWIAVAQDGHLMEGQGHFEVISGG
ncbi:MAG: copper resistance CopC family protein [Alphaproteobacteria bacterium]